MLFGKDYVEFSNYLGLGFFVSIRGKIQTKWNREGELEFKPLQVELLNDMKAKRFKEVNVKLNLAEINDITINGLLEIITSNPGKFNFKLNVYDMDEKYDVAMFSRTMKIDLNKDVQKSLLEIVGEENVSFG
jgi:DNA polymerase-3 subunit alpha